MMSVPTDQQHGEIHCSRGKDEVKEAIAVRDIILRLHILFPELQQTPYQVTFDAQNLNKIERRNPVDFRMNLKALGVDAC